MSTTASEDDRCKALTRDGERCSRPAQGDGFCHQHDPSDETVTEDEDGGTGNESDGDAADEGNEGDGEEEPGEDPAGVTAERESDMSSDETRQTDIGEVRATVQDVAEGVVGHALDGIVSIDDTDEGWRVAVEVVERESVPDTQDILGRYEIEFDEALTVTGYRRTHRYRRDDMSHDV